MFWGREPATLPPCIHWQTALWLSIVLQSVVACAWEVPCGGKACA
jgi:hypothetical protein